MNQKSNFLSFFFDIDYSYSSAGGLGERGGGEGGESALKARTRTSVLGQSVLQKASVLHKLSYLCKAFLHECRCT